MATPLRPLLAVVLLQLGLESASADGHCDCAYNDNSWFHLITSLTRLSSTEGGLAAALSASDGAVGSSGAHAWGLVRGTRCDADAGVFPNDGGAVDLQHLPAGFCAPGQVVMSMLCIHQFLADGAVDSALKWAQVTQGLLSLVQGCMDMQTPFPLQAAELGTWVAKLLQEPLPEYSSDSAAAFLASTSFDGKIELRRDTATAWLQCLPLRDPSCFPAGASHPFESCQECCDTVRFDAEQGNPNCWGGPYTFERCCNKPAPPPSTPPPLAAAAASSAAGDCSSQEQANERLAEQLGKANELAEECFGKLAAAEANAKQQRQQAEVEAAAISEEAKTREAEVERLREELTRAKEVVTAAEDARSEASTQEQEDLKAKSVEAERLRGELAKAGERAEADAAEAERLRAELQQATEAAAQASEEGRVAAEAAQQELKAKAAELESVGSELAGLKDTIAQRDEELKQLRVAAESVSEVETLNKELAQVKQDLAAASKQEEARASELDKANKELKDMKQALADSSTKEKVQATDLGKLTQELKEAQKELASKTEQLRLLGKDSSQAEEVKQAGQLVDALGDVERLTEDLASVKVKQLASDAKLAAVARSEKKLAKQLAAAQAGKSVQMEACTAPVPEIDRLASELAEAKAALARRKA